MSREVRVGLLDREQSVTKVAGLSLLAQTQLLGLNRTSLYYRPTPPSHEELAIKRRIDEIYTARPFYGIRRITAQLHQEGVVVNHKAVARHMREMGLSAIYPGPSLSKRARRSAHQHYVYPYLLRGVTAQEPDHVWGIDITYIRMVDGWLYLVAVLDWYSRYIVSWELSQSLGQSFVTQAVREALCAAKPLIFNSDQGSHFTSPQYTGLLIEAGVQISMDGRGRFVDNIFTERLWRTIKYEEVYLHEYSTPKEARQNLSQYIHFYNRERLHQALDYQTPASVYGDQQANSHKGVSSTLKLAG
jgi:putative transposase